MSIHINHPVNPAPVDAPTWTTTTMQEDFIVTGFGGGMVFVKRKADRQVGTLEFNGNPRVYHSFRPDWPAGWVHQPLTDD